MPDAGATEAALKPQPRRWPRWLALLAITLIGGALLVVAVLDSPIGNRYAAERIAALAPVSGLRIKVGRIEGSLYGSAILRDVTLADPSGVFARIPEAELDWRPFSWFCSGLDVRSLVARRGILLRLPKLNPGDPSAPILPNFDIRLDRLQLDNFRVAKGILGQARRFDLRARADIRDGRALLRIVARAGGGDRVFALLDAAPERDRFDVKLDYAAPRGGLLATIAGADSDLRTRIAGQGGWQRWDGALLAEQGGKRLAALRLTNRAGRYGFLGQIEPTGLLSGISARAAGKVVDVSGETTLVASRLNGQVGITTAALKANARGAVDLAGNAFDNLKVVASLTDPALAGGDLRLDGARLSATLDGAFRDLGVIYDLRAATLRSGVLRAETLALDGTATFDGVRWQAPLRLTAVRFVTGDPNTDTRLVGVRAETELVLIDNRLSADRLAIDLPGLAARLTLRGDLDRGAYGLAGPVAARGLVVPNLGLVDADAKIALSFGNVPWSLRADTNGRMVRTDNATLADIAGSNIRVAGGLSLGAGRPLLFDRAQLTASKLTLTLSGSRFVDGRTAILGSGRHVDYGPFTIDAGIDGAGLRAELVFADPLPAAGLKDVRVALAPIADGFRIETAGGSTLGPFSGTLGLFTGGERTRLEIERLDVYHTLITGSLALAGNAASGNLRVAGGGLDGTIGLAPRGGGQGFDIALTAQDARFGGNTSIGIGSGQLQASGSFAKDRSTITGSLLGRDIAWGTAYVGQIAAAASLRDGRGTVTASLAGRRGSRFDLQLAGDVAPGRFAVLARGEFAGRRIAMPRRAVLTRADGGWQLAPTQIDFAGGRMIASGEFGAATQLQLALANMPLSLADIVFTDVGLGGAASGLIDYRQQRGGLPTGEVRLQIKDLSRSGLVLASRPIDVALVGQLTAGSLETRAVMTEGGALHGRLQARISGLPGGGDLAQRLSAGQLFSQVRYSGPVDAVWRLVGLEQFDLTGPVSLAGDVTGSVSSPQIRGAITSDALRLQSALTGTDVTGLVVRGRFSGSRLQLDSFSGQTGGDGRVQGSGSVDLARLGERGPAIDIRIAAQRARLLARPEMAATVTGPLRIVSDGVGGTIAGRLAIITANWRLGNSAATEQLPALRTREINGRINAGAAAAPSAPWRYLIDAQGANRINVRGLGLDSEWGADIRLRGSTDAPAISGRADLVRGGYEFAGKRFELTRGRISFDGGSPPDPRLDIAAQGEESGVTALITVTGSSLKPEIRFSSTPALPEEELLSRILFGNSITNISAPEALQLGAALASLRGGGGLDPINKLRSAIGLDRLRIVPSDAATGRATGVAAGKYFGRRFYAEIITDGRGYSATQAEFRVTSWLALLASVSTVGKQSLNVRASRDY